MSCATAEIPTTSTIENGEEDLLQTIVDKEEIWGAISPSVCVTDIDLKQLYMKIQKKTTLVSEQRIENGIVRFTVSVNVQIAKVRSYVQRCSDWIEETVLGCSEKGRSELQTKVVGQEINTYHYHLDLDSVYLTENGMKVYELEKNKGEDRNNWVLFIAVELIDQTTKEFVFGPFRLKTKPPKKQKTKKRR